jgi:hypothetical protein
LNAINNNLKNFVNKDSLWKIKLLENWRNVIGNFKKNFFLEKIDNDILFLRVTNSSWAQEANIMSLCIIERVNEFLGKKKINRIVVRIRNCKEQAKGHHKVLIDEASKNLSIDDYHLYDYQKNVVNSINDDELRKNIASFFDKCRGRKSFGS